MKQDEEAGEELRRGPWTVDEDLTLINYIAGRPRRRAMERARAHRRYVRLRLSYLASVRNNQLV
jgi:hypothetical protein